jgi:hypothetical protein
MERLRACGAAGLRQGEIHNRGRWCTGNNLLSTGTKTVTNQRLRVELVLSGVWSASAVVSRLVCSQALTSLDVQRGELEAVGAGLQGLQGRDVEGFGMAVASEVG